MTVRYLSATLCLFISSTLAQGQSPDGLIELTRRSRMLAPGLTHWEYEFVGPYTLDVIELKLGRPGFVVESYRPDSLTPLTRQLADRERMGERVLAGINADFFSFQTHEPVGNQFARGEPVRLVRSRRSHFVMTRDGRIHLGPLTWNGDVRSSRGTRAELRGINIRAESTGVTLLNRFSRRWRAEDSTRTQVFLQPSVPERGADMMWRYIVADRFALADQTPRDGSALLSATTAHAFLGGVSVGDTVEVLLTSDALSGPVETCVGGAGRIVIDGKTVPDSLHLEEGLNLKFTTDRHPRTFIAIDADTSTLFLCTVDGRQATSKGMNFAEMAVFLRLIGAHHAVNLDGGGSTTMVVEGAIVNSPSDVRGERAVANALLVVRRN